MPFPETFLTELTERSDIVDVVSGYVRLSKRSGAKPGALLSADSKALMKGVKVLSAADYGDEEDDSTTETKTFYKKLKSFADAYNYTMESSEEVGDRSTKKIRKELDALREQEIMMSAAAKATV